MKILTGGQFRELDRITIDTEPIASIELMERASHAVADVIRQRFDTGRRIIVFAGPGGNGGDGLAVARILANDGRDVTAYLFNVGSRLSEDCTTNRDIHKKSKGYMCNRRRNYAKVSRLLGIPRQI